MFKIVSYCYFTHILLSESLLKQFSDTLCCLLLTQCYNNSTEVEVIEMIRKILIAIGCLLVVLLIVGLGYTFVKWKNNGALKSVIQKETKIAEKSLDIQHKDKIGQSYYLTTGGKATNIYEELVTWNETSLSRESLSKDQIAILRVTTQKTNFKGVKKAKIHQVVYKKQFLSYEKQSDKILREFHIKSDQTIFTLDDLFNNANSRLNEEVGKLYPGKTYVKPDLRADFKSNGLASDAFDYKDSQIILNNGDFKIPLQNLYDVINVSYLKEADLTAYNAFQEDKVAKEKAAAEEKSRQEDAARQAEEARQAEAAKEAEESKNPSANTSTGKVVALTFDDGPSNATTPQVLDILARYGIRATFFVLGSRISGNESILQRMVAAGDEIGNHTWSHTSLPSLSMDQLSWQISSTNQAVQNATGVSPKIFRPPYGATNGTVQASIGLHQVLWTVDTLDWQSHNTQAILANVQAQTKSGGVILMHDIHQTTVNALPTVVDYLISQGYSFVTVSQLYGY